MIPRKKDPTLVLGTVQWGMPYGIANRRGQPSSDEVRGMLELARSSGVTTLDTARAYGTSEEVIGELTEHDQTWRVITKIHPDVGHSDDPDEVAAAVTASLTTSRSCLRRDPDIVLLHRPQQLRAAGGAAWECLQREREEGRVGAIGVSASSPQSAIDALEETKMDVIQVATSLFDQRLVRAGFFDRAAETEIEVFVRSAYLQGAAFLDPEALPEHLGELAGPLQTTRRWAVEHGHDLATVLLGFVRTLGANPVVGLETSAQLQASINAWTEPLEATELSRLADAIPPLPDDVLEPGRWADR